MAARYEWIGWNAEQRARHLPWIVNNSRFLVLPWVRVKGLASKILAHSARQLPIDWERRYGYRPLLLENLSGRTAIRWHLLPGRELDPGGANARTRKDGSPTPSRGPRSQRHLPLSTVSQRPTRTLPRRPSHPLRFSKSEAVNKYKKRCPSKAPDFFSRLRSRARQKQFRAPAQLAGESPTSKLTFWAC